jgi:hypothetical protein
MPSTVKVRDAVNPPKWSKSNIPAAWARHAVRSTESAQPILRSAKLTFLMNSLRPMNTMTAAVVVTTLEILFDSQPRHEPRAAPAAMVNANMKESNN